MNKQKKTRVVVAGGGTSGWLCAYTLMSRLGALIDITLIESDQIGSVGVGEATIPTMRSFHKLIGIDEQEFMAQTQATFKLGIQFENWGKQGESYIHSFGEIGQRAWMAEFHNFWLQAKADGYAGDLGDFCLELQAAKENKFAVAIGKRSLNYAFHLNATDYAAYLRKKAESGGVKRREGQIAAPIIDKNTGNLSALVMEDGEQIEGDLFIDCTGFRGLLIGEYLGVGYEDWSHYLASDSAIAVQTASIDSPVPYTRAIAHDAGWQWRIPLQSRTGNGIVYSSQFLSDESAEALLLSNLDGNTLTSPRKLKFKTGIRNKAWHKNCVAIGLSSGFLEPLESTSIHLVTTALLRLMKLFPFSDNHQLLADRFNKETTTELETIRDFIILHYHQTSRKDSAFWNHYRTMEIPDSLAHRLDIFRENAYVWPDDVALFRADSWVQVMMGQGLAPKQHHEAGKLLASQHLQQQMQVLKNQIDSQVAQLPQHSVFIEKYCPSPK